jgi:hypothetical protein
MQLDGGVGKSAALADAVMPGVGAGFVGGGCLGACIGRNLLLLALAHSCTQATRSERAASSRIRARGTHHGLMRQRGVLSPTSGKLESP